MFVTAFHLLAIVLFWTASIFGYLIVHMLLGLINPLMTNDAFRHHKRFHLLEKGQFSQEKVQMCENQQLRRADIGEKIHGFLERPLR